MPIKTYDNSRKNRQSRKKLKCKICGKYYLMHSYRVKTSKYCSRKCWSKRAVVKECPNCGKKFTYANGGRKYCSAECCYEHRVGENAPAWKDGKSLERQRARYGNDLKNWRKKVYQRDGYKCKYCGSQEYLNAHHIIPFSKNKKLAFEISNGITLCEKCHGKIHNKDFSNRRYKECPMCGMQTTGRGKEGLCRSCAVTIWHIKKKYS